MTRSFPIPVSLETPTVMLDQMIVHSILGISFMQNGKLTEKNLHTKITKRDDSTVLEIYGGVPLLAGCSGITIGTMFAEEIDDSRNRA